MITNGRLKLALGAIAVALLGVLNLMKYSSVESSAAVSRVEEQDLKELIIPDILVDNAEGNYARDIFVRLHVDERGDDEESEPTESEDVEISSAEFEEDVVEIESHSDLTLLGISVRAGASMAMVKYKGRSYFVASGDVVGGRYFIERIDESGVYVSAE